MCLRFGRKPVGNGKCRQTCDRKNGRGNHRLLHDVPEPLLSARGLSRARSGPVDLETLVELLGALVSEETP